MSLIDDVENPTIALPDLSPDVTEVLITYETIELDDRTGQWILSGPRLEFNTLAQNFGHVPLDLRADDLTAAPTGSPVSQCVSWTTDYVCRDRRLVGGFEWHDDHKHYHFGDFASYELRHLLPDGTADFTAAGLISTSPKLSFCLVDSHPIRDYAAPVPRYSQCNPVEEGVSPGWADEYPSGIDGQLLPLAGVGDGRYALVLTMNGAHRVWETDHSNNRMVAIVEISGIGNFFPEAAIMDKALV